MQVRTFGIFLQRIERVSHTTLTNQLQSGSGHPVEYIYFLGPILELVGEDLLKLECGVRIFKHVAGGGLEDEDSSYPSCDFIKYWRYESLSKHSERAKVNETTCSFRACAP